MNGNLWLFRLIMFLVGIGWAYVVIRSMPALFAQVSPRDTGRATALYNAQRQLAVGPRRGNPVDDRRHAGAPAPASPATSAVFRIAFFAAAGFTFVGAMIALAIRDKDAASTMRRKPATATPTAIPAA